MYIQLRNYYVVISNSYLIFALLFLLSMFDQLLVSINSEVFLIDILVSVSFVIIHLILIQLASELINHKLPLSRMIWWIHGIITFIGLFILKYLLLEDIISEDYSTVKFLIGEPLRIAAGFTLIYGITKSNLIIKSRRTTFIKNGWILTGIIIALSGIIQFGIYSLDLWYDLILDRKNSPIPISIAEGFSLLSVLFLALFTSVIAIFYPEAMLLSYAQVIKAAKLYDLISDDESSEDESLSKLPFRAETPEVLIDYVKSLPDDIIESLDKDGSSRNDN